MLDIDEIACYPYEETGDCSRVLIAYRGELFLITASTACFPKTPKMYHYTIHALSDTLLAWKLAPITNGFVKEHLLEEVIKEIIKDICLEIEDFYI